MDRRSFLRRALGGAGSLALASSLRPFAHAADAPAPAARRPNIIVILSDDMGFSDIGCYGGEINTPNLDRLAAGGLRFSQFYNTARCCPTRACLLTGLYPHQAGVGHMMERRGLDGYEGDLNTNCVTIAQVLKPAGYSTYGVGKWHVTRFDTPDSDKHNWPLQRGFDRYYGTLRGAGSYYDPAALTRDNTMISPFADPQYRPARYYYTDAVSDNASRFIDEHRQARPETPFFMYVAYTAAHWPMHALEEDIARYRGKYDGGYEPVRRRRLERLREPGLVRRDWELSPQAGDWDKVGNKAWEARCMEVYAAMIDRMDQGIGRIVQTLSRNGMLENTLILFLQDNGGCAENVGRPEPQTRPTAFPAIAADVIRLDVRPNQTRSGRPMRMGTEAMPGPEDTYIAYGQNWANVSNTPFREYKHFVHEGGIATPLIAHWPAGIQRHGQIEHQPGHLIDIMTTCVDLSGARYPEQHNTAKITPMEGRSLVPAFNGKTIDREAIFWEHEGNRALRVGKWKLVAKHPTGKWELYDMDNDRTEMHDLAQSDPQRTSAMAAQWEAWAKRTSALPWPWKPPYGRREPGAVAVMAFDLKQGDELARRDAPYLPGRSIAITATIEPAADDGVIVAQGGTQHGFALYLKNGRLVLATRHSGKMATVTSPARLGRGQTQVAANLAKDGTLRLLINGAEVASARSPGAIEKMPVDGLQVGSDFAGAVGEYKAPNRFDGKITKLRIELSE